MPAWRPGEPYPAAGAGWRPGAAPAPTGKQSIWGTIGALPGKVNPMTQPKGRHGQGVTTTVNPPPATTPPPTTPVSDIYGTESGPTYLEKRYLDRMSGEDAAYNYALKRGGDDIDRRMAAGGSYNSGARGQQLSDFGANVFAQSQKQLDELAGAATGARQHKVDSMLGTGLGLAGGQAGVSSLYDKSIADFTNQNNLQNIMLQLNRGGVDSAGNKAGINNLLTIAGLFA